jgi:hypothetical protein
MAGTGVRRQSLRRGILIGIKRGMAGRPQSVTRVQTLRA